MSAAGQGVRRHPLPGRSSGRSSAAFRSGAGRGVRRIALHAALLDAVPAAGVRVVHGDVGEVTQDWASVSRGGNAGAVLGGGRRSALADPAVARPGDAVPRPAPVGNPQACADRAVDGSRGGALGPRGRGVRDAGGRRLCGDRDPVLAAGLDSTIISAEFAALGERVRWSPARPGHGGGPVAAEGSKPGRGAGAAGG